MDYLIVKTHGILEIDDYREIADLVIEHKYDHDAAIDLIMAGFTVADIRICITNNIPASAAVALSRYQKVNE